MIIGSPGIIRPSKIGPTESLEISLLVTGPRLAGNIQSTALSTSANVAAPSPPGPPVPARFAASRFLRIQSLIFAMPISESRINIALPNHHPIVAARSFAGFGSIARSGSAFSISDIGIVPPISFISEVRSAIIFSSSAGFFAPSTSLCGTPSEIAFALNPSIKAFSSINCRRTSASLSTIPCNASGLSAAAILSESFLTSGSSATTTASSAIFWRI